MSLLDTHPYLQFPLRIGPDGAATSSRSEHVRQLIEQVLFTSPLERVFRPEFGAGVRALVFEPNASVLRQVAHQRLTASLAEALRGEVDAKTLRVSAEQDERDPEHPERLVLTIEYQLAALGQHERLTYSLPGGSHG